MRKQCFARYKQDNNICVGPFDTKDMAAEFLDRNGLSEYYEIVAFTDDIPMPLVHQGYLCGNGQELMSRALSRSPLMSDESVQDVILDVLNDLGNVPVFDAEERVNFFNDLADGVDESDAWDALKREIGRSARSVIDRMRPMRPK